MSEESTTSDSGRGGSEEDLHRGAAPQELGKDNLWLNNVIIKSNSCPIKCTLLTSS